MDEDRKSILSLIDVGIQSIEKFILAGGMISVSLIVFVNVITRKFFNFTIIWAEEIARYLIVWVTFIGLSSCVRENMHVSIDIVIQKLPGRVRKVYNKFLYLILILVGAYLSYLGALITEKLYLSGNKSVTAGIAIWLIYLPIPIGFGLMTLNYLKKLFSRELIEIDKEGGN